MFKVTKIEDKSLNLDVQGQGCWDDCYHGGQWELRSSTSTPGCNYTGSYWDAVTNAFL